MADNQMIVKVSADASGYTAELDKARRSTDAFSATQTQAAQRIATAQKAIAEAATNGSNASARAINNFVSQLQRTADQAGKTRAQLLEMKAAQLGIADSVSGYIGQLEAASKATHEFSLNSSGARRELLVLAHEASQGNWTRFAGSIGVLAERTDALGMILSPVGAGLLAAGAAAAFFIEQIVKGNEEIAAFNRAITSTNGYIGVSAAQMAEMSSGLQDNVNHLSAVREAMAQVASTGAFTADNLQLATRAALAMSDDIGVGTDKAAESLARIQENVLEWVAKYQSAHHTFTAAQVEEIDNFVKQGDTAAAVRAVMQDLSSAHAKIADDANKNMGAVVSWWHQWGDVIDRVKESIRGIGTPDSIDKQVGGQYSKVEAAQRNLDQMRGGSQINIDTAKQELAVEMDKLNVLRQQQTVINTQQRAREAAAKGGDAKVAVDSYLNSDKYANPSQKHSLELGAENASFAKATADLEKNSATYQAALKRHYENVEQINAEYAKKTRVHGNSAAFSGELAAQTAANQLIEAEEKRHEIALKAQRDLGAIDSETYLRDLNAIQERAIDQEIANAQKRVDIAKAKPETAAYQEALKDLQKLQGQRLDLEQGLTDSLAQLQQKRAEDVQRYAMQAAKPGQQQGAAYSAQDATRYSTPQDAAAYTAKLQLAQQYAQNVTALWEKYALDPASDQKAFQQKMQWQQDSYANQMDQLDTHLAQEQARRNSYSDQMHLAVTKLGGDAQTNAQMVSTAFTSAWQDASNALDQFITTGKGNFDSFTAGILADLAKIALHQAEMALFQSVGTAFFSTGGPVGSFATGGAIVGAGTGTSDSIPAMLSNGEYVVKASQAKKYGSLLESINSGGVSHFASGGAVGSVAPSTSGSGGSPVSVTVHNNGGQGLNNQDAKELHTIVQAFVDRRMDQKMRGQGGYSYQMKYGQI